METWVTMSYYRAVLFDWVGTLVDYRDGGWIIRRALTSLGRAVSDDVCSDIEGLLSTALSDADVIGAMQTEDCSPELHRAANMLWFERAGVDGEFAEALYATNFDPEMHPMFPDTPEVVASVAGAGVQTAVVSNFHRALWPVIEAYGLGGFIDEVVVSSELGFQKPDLRMFTTALDRLGVAPSETLMVGDWASMDGPAAEVGIDTLILPRHDGRAERGLSAVVRLVEASDRR